MKDHFTELLQAYHDNELPDWQVEQLEDHLSKCQHCQAELTELQALSTLLHSVQPMIQTSNPAEFAKKLIRLLPQRPAAPIWQRSLKLGWQLSPLAMMLVLVFAQTSVLVNNLIIGVNLLGGIPVEETLSQLGANLSPGIALTIPDHANSFFGSIGVGSLFGFDISFNLTLPAFTSLLALSWLAGWWISQRQNDTKNEPSNKDG